MVTSVIEENGRSERRKMFSPGKHADQVTGKIVDSKGRESKEFLATIIYSNRKEMRDTTVDLASAISEGFPAGAIVRLVKHLAIPQKEMLGLLSITSSTYNRRREQGKLEATESDRVYRYAKLVSLSTQMFHGDEEAARRWLKSPAYLFKGETPLEHAKTEYGAREVEALIGRIRHGIPS